MWNWHIYMLYKCRRSYLAANDGADLIVWRGGGSGDVRVAVAQAAGAVQIEAGWTNSRASHGCIMNRASQPSWPWGSKEKKAAMTRRQWKFSDKMVEDQNVNYVNSDMGCLRWCSLQEKLKYFWFKGTNLRFTVVGLIGIISFIYLVKMSWSLCRTVRRQNRWR